jgi:hypothetical protein
MSVWSVCRLYLLRQNFSVSFSGDTSSLAGARTSTRRYIPVQSLISFVNWCRLTGTSVITKSGEHMNMLGSIVYPAGKGDLFIGTSGGSSCRGALFISVVS